MATSTLRPTSTVDVDGSIVNGAANAHTALSDDSDSSSIGPATGEGAIVGLGDLTLPAGGVIKQVAVRARTSKNVGTVVLRGILAATGLPANSADVTITWSAATTVTLLTLIGSSSTDISDSEIDAATLELRSVSGDLNVFEAYVDVTYVARPTLNVTEPSVSPIEDTNVPTIEWTATLDGDGGAQTRYEVRVFTDAIYGGGGFNAATSTAAAESGQVAASGTSWQVDEPLADDTYRAYVRVAQTVNGTLHWSDWDYIQFDVLVDLPAVPLLTVTADSAEGRHIIELDDQAGDATTDMFELQRSTDSGTTWEHVRGLLADGLITPSAGAATAYDYEAPNGTDTTYRARALHDYSGLYAASAWAEDAATWSSTQVWLKHPTRPELNIAINVHSFPDRKKAARQGVFQALGATYPIVVSDTRNGATGTIALRSDTAAERDNLDTLLDLVTTLLLQFPASAGEPDRWVRLGDHDRVRGIDKSFSISRFETFPWIEVREPSGVVEEWPEEGS